LSGGNHSRICITSTTKTSLLATGLDLLAVSILKAALKPAIEKAEFAIGECDECALEMEEPVTLSNVLS
jgi:hypothetical protein